MARTASPNRFELERALASQGMTRIAGVDEAGRGPLAGPVVAAAVMFPTDWIRAAMPPELVGINDSKRLTEAQRNRYFDAIQRRPEILFRVAIVTADQIDRINILKATQVAMNQCLAELRPEPQHVLVDGRPVPSLRFPQSPIVKGDSKSYSIGAASILAKVTRDRLMFEFEKVYSGYGFATNKGYGTAEHLAALDKLGPCAIHRRSFAPLRPRQTELLLP